MFCGGEQNDSNEMHDFRILDSEIIYQSGGPRVKGRRAAPVRRDRNFT